MLFLLDCIGPSRDLQDAHFQSYIIRDQLYVAGLNVDLYQADGYDTNTACVHLFPVIVVPILTNLIDIGDQSNEIINDASVLANLFSLFYISHETRNDMGLYAAALGTLSTFLHMSLSRKTTRTSCYCVFQAVDLHTVVLGLFALVSVEAIIDAGMWYRR